MIKIIITDIDGVMTDGKFYIDSDLKPMKSIAMKDLDAFTDIKKDGIAIGMITGESNEFSEYVKTIVKPNYFYAGCKDKVEAIGEISAEEGYAMDEICYIGDGKYDIDAIKYVGMGICPADAIAEVKAVANFKLSSSGGTGCIAEAAAIVKNYNAKCNQVFSAMGKIESNDIATIIDDHIDLANRIKQDLDLNRNIRRAIDVIKQSFISGGQLLLCGNGGSAADAQHIATEFVSRFYLERKGLNAEALNVNTSSLTAIGNDYDYERVYARQIEAKGKKGDVLIGITTSGTSRNIIKAFMQAKELEITTIAFVGAYIKEVEAVADIIISVQAALTPRIQEMHIMLGHIICEFVEKELFADTGSKK